MTTGLAISVVVREKRRRVRVTRSYMRDAQARLADTQNGKPATADVPASMALVPEMLRPAGRNYEPPRGTVLHRLWRGRKLTRRQCQAAEKFFEIVGFAVEGGGSGGLLPTYAPRVQSSRQEFYPTFFQNYYLRELQAIERSVCVHEWLVLRGLVRDFYWHGRGGDLDLEYFGTLCSGYKDRRQAYAAGVSRIQCVLTSLAEYMGF